LRRSLPQGCPACGGGDGMKGYAGKITTVDLTSGTVRDSSFDEAFARKYLGGNGFAAKVLCDRVPEGADPLVRKMPSSCARAPSPAPWPMAAAGGGL
jgi:hypothetical protein